MACEAPGSQAHVSDSVCDATFQPALLSISTVVTDSNTRYSLLSWLLIAVA